MVALLESKGIGLKSLQEAIVAHTAFGQLLHQAAQVVQVALRQVGVYIMLPSTLYKSIRLTMIVYDRNR